MKRALWFASTAALGLTLVVSLLFVAKGGLAQSPGDISDPTPDAAPPLSLAAFGPATAGAGILSVAGSSVTTEQCYQAGNTQTLCFTVYNGSTDGEWLDQVELTFPDFGGLGPWTVACNAQDTTDSVGYSVSMSCSTPSANQVRYVDSDSDGYGEISNGASWGFCVAVTVPAGYGGPRITNWSLRGDHSNETSDQITIEPCTPLWFKSTTQNVEGCNGITQTHTFELHNYAAGSGTVNLSYETSPEGSAFSGPSSFQMSDGEVVTFVVQLKPDFFLKPGQQVTATLTASGNGHSDATALVNTVTELAGWQALTDTSVAAMDNVVVWASESDGGLWAIGGYGSDGATQRYDPAADAWQTFEPETVITPAIEYPVDGCYGLNGDGDEIVVLFPDTLVTDTLHVFNITDRQWSTRPTPGFFPGNYIGHWGFDVVSLLNNPVVKAGITNKNVCYLSGGNHEKPGGGSTRNLWRYDPETNGGEHIGEFVDSNVVFGFHASWYVPWIGDDGAICVGGGADHNHVIHSTTRCYDLAAGTFNTANADLGPLPEPWWGMADGWQVQDGEYQIWIANGVAQDGTLLPASAYASATSGGFVPGPALPVGLYRLEGTGFNDQFVTAGGSQGGFWYSKHHLRLTQCPTCYENYVPAVLRNH
jgi:hypothetical protein